MKFLEPQFIKDFTSGVVTHVNENLIPPNGMSLALNVDCDFEVGSAVSRLGSSVVGAQLVDNNSILGLHDFRYGTGSGKLLATINASGGATSVVYDVNAASTIRTGLTASTKMRFVTFLDSVLMVNGSNAEASYDGTTVITTGGAFDLANIPSSNTVNIAIEWRDRVYVAGDNTEPDRLYYSSTPSAGAVSWTSGNGNVDIEPEDGGGTITALGKVPGYLLIFKERSLKRWNFDSAFPETLVNLGTLSQESVINAAGVCAFFSSSSTDAVGFYVTNGGRPIPISHGGLKNIKKWVKAIPAAYYDDVSGWGNEEHFFWSIGDVTVDGVAYTNVVVRWSVRTKEWVVRSYPSEFLVWSSYVSSNDNLIVAGDDDGTIIQVDAASVYTDYPSTTPIKWRIESQDEKFGYNQVKEISERIVVYSRTAKGAKLLIKVNGGDWRDYGEIMSDVAEIKLPIPIRGNYFRFAITGNQTGARAYIKEIEVPKIAVLENYSL